MNNNYQVYQIENEDRHGSNWSVMSIEGKLELVPSYDHGVSLGSRNSDEDKLSRSLSEHTNESSFSHFKDEKGSLSVFNTFLRAAKLEPEAAQIWLEKLKAITPEQIDEIFDRIPDGRITPISDRFARQLLAYNREKILSIVPERQPLRDSILQVARQLKQDACDLSIPLLYSTKETLKAIASITNGNHNPTVPTVTTTSPRVNNLDELQLERSAISAILQVPQALDDMILRGFTSECLINPQHREICSAAVDYHGEHGEVNLSNIRNRLSKDAATTATSLVENTNASILLPLDVGRLITFNQRRDLVDIAEQLELAAVDSSCSNDDLRRVLDESKRAIRETEGRSPRLPELTINESQPEPKPKKNSSKGR